jgi:DNA-directed RNA polymerase specialized sigma24 family protein
LEETAACGAWHAREVELATALGIAEEFLNRWDDGFTTTNRDDIGLQSAILAVERWDSLREKSRFPSFVRTIVRRRRASLVRENVRRKSKGHEVDCGNCDEFEQPRSEQRWYFVAGAWICQSEMIHTLPDVLEHLSQLNVRILLGFYEGFSCAELAARFDLTIDSVKIRVHRSRRRVRGIFELMAAPETSELRTGLVPLPHKRVTRPVADNFKRREICD